VPADQGIIVCLGCWQQHLRTCTDMISYAATTHVIILYILSRIALFSVVSCYSEESFLAPSATQVTLHVTNRSLLWVTLGFWWKKLSLHHFDPLTTRCTRDAALLGNTQTTRFIHQSSPTSDLWRLFTSRQRQQRSLHKHKVAISRV
jgi:hypothetical protein